MLTGRSGFAATIELDVSDIAGATEQLRLLLGDFDVVKMVPTADPGDLREFYDRFADSLGTTHDAGEDWARGGAPTHERWQEIRYREDVPDMAAFRHSKNAQPLHTDESYVTKSAGVMLFYCVKRAVSGGATVFVSGRELVAELERSEPELLERLRTIEVTYQKAGDSVTRPILVFDPDGRPNLNFNYYCAEPNQSAAALALNEDFHQYLERSLPQELVFEAQLSAGESVAWRDSAVLHGRNAFEAIHTGDREIWKTAVELAPVDRSAG